jgi:predicted permease
VSETTIDASVLAFTALLSLSTVLLFGLVPALHVGRADLQGVLKENGRANTAGSRRNRVRRALVTGEVAMAVVLAAGAALMLRSFWNLVEMDPGFRAENVLTMRLNAPAAFYPDEPDVIRFYSTLLERVRALPGVEHAGLIRVLPIDQEIGDACVMVDGYTPPDGQCAAADWQAASDGYFEAMGLELVEGRFVEASDTRDAQQVILVNEAFVRNFYNGESPIGRPVRFAFQDSVPYQTVVGVVGDARHNGITGQIKPTFYRPFEQWARSTGFPQRTVSLVVHSGSDALALAAPIRAEIGRLDPRLPVSSVQLMEQVLSHAVAQPRFTLLMLLAFSGIALLLAVIGIYGVVSYAVAARRQELGIRMALGAAPRSVVWLSLRDGLVFAGAGVFIGLGGALLATRVLRSFVYGIATTDAPTYVAVCALGLTAAFIASWIPARRASRTDPLATLRTE